MLSNKSIESKFNKSIKEMYAIQRKVNKDSVADGEFFLPFSELEASAEQIENWFEDDGITMGEADFIAYVMNELDKPNPQTPDNL